VRQSMGLGGRLVVAVSGNESVTRSGDAMP
jgi:hypothetical protein